MMITIPWEDGTDDNFYIDFTDVDNPIVTSDENTLQIDRSKLIRFSTPVESVTSVLYLKVEQKFNGIIIPTFTNVASAYGQTVPGF